MPNCVFFGLQSAWRGTTQTACYMPDICFGPGSRSFSGAFTCGRHYFNLMNSGANVVRVPRFMAIIVFYPLLCSTRSDADVRCRTRHKSWCNEEESDHGWCKGQLSYMNMVAQENIRNIMMWGDALLAHNFGMAHRHWKQTPKFCTCRTARARIWMSNFDINHRI